MDSYVNVTMSDWWRNMSSTRAMMSVGAAVATAGAALYVATRPSPPNHHGFSLDNQSRQVTGEPAEVRCSQWSTEGQAMQNGHDGITTFYEAFQQGARTSNGGKCMAWKPSKDEPFHSINYSEVLQMATDIGAGLLSQGISPDNTSRIGICTKNRYEYVVTNLACCAYSMVVVPLYDTLGCDACSFIIKQADIEVVICDTTARLRHFLEERHLTPSLRVIVCLNAVDDASLDMARRCDIKLLSWTQLEKCGKDNPVSKKLCRADDLYMICYTSGTTGHPKGAMITHRNLVAVLKSIQFHMAIGLGSENITPNDSYLSYLPLAHLYENVNQAFIFNGGGQVGFYQGDVRLLTKDLMEFKPTIFATVPRVLNRIYDKVMTAVASSSLAGYVFQLAYQSKLREVLRGITRRNTIWDKLFFHRVQASLGGRIRMVCCGSAPLSPKILLFIRCALGCPVMEGYGQTECTAIASVQLPADSDTGTVGPPLCCNSMKVVDVPDMNYSAANGQGEICVKGDNVFSGYLKMPEETAQVIDKDGWLHTGDIGAWMPNGTMKLIDRKKNIFKLAQGEYVAPEKIENIYIRSVPVAQIMVHGDSLKASLIAIVVLDHESIHKWVKKRLNIERTLSELCNNESVKRAIIDDLIDLGKKAGLHQFEQVQDIILQEELFSIENGLLTPTLKTKRHHIQKTYASRIQQIYSTLP